jgi:hypothetical protein
MKALENRQIDSKREMDILDALQDIRARNARNERVGQSVDLLERIGLEEVETEEDRQRKLEEEEDEELVRQVFSKIPIAGSSALPSHTSSSSPTSSGNPDDPSVTSITTSVPQMTVKRKADGQEPDLHALLPESTRVLISSKASLAPAAKKAKTGTKNSLGIKIVKGKGKAPIKT